MECMFYWIQGSEHLRSVEPDGVHYLYILKRFQCNDSLDIVFRLCSSVVCRRDVRFSSLCIWGLQALFCCSSLSKAFLSPSPSRSSAAIPRNRVNILVSLWSWWTRAGQNRGQIAVYVLLVAFWGLNFFASNIFKFPSETSQKRQMSPFVELKITI